MTSSADQGAYRLRCEWGPDGGSVVASGADVAVVGGLRVAVVDLWGAGAVLSTLVGGGASPEASVAAAAFAAIRPRLGEEMRACSSWRELSGLGFADDVAVASELDTSTVVPILVDGCSDRREPLRRAHGR